MSGNTVHSRIEGGYVYITCYLEPGYTADDIKMSVESDDILITGIRILPYKLKKFYQNGSFLSEYSEFQVIF